MEVKRKYSTMKEWQQNSCQDVKSFLFERTDIQENNIFNSKLRFSTERLIDKFVKI